VGEGREEREEGEEEERMDGGIGRLWGWDEGEWKRTWNGWGWEPWEGRKEEVVEESEEKEG
jgi:hypothetical protein